MKDVVIHVKRIIKKDDELPSLYNFLLGLNMLKFKRYLDLQDLIKSNPGEVVSSSVYECETETQKEIDLYIEDLKRDLINLRKQKLEIISIKSYLPTNELREVDFKTLEYFYGSNGSNSKNNFAKDQENVVLFAARMFSTFVDSFENILNGKINISGVGYIELFAKDFFPIELTKLKYLIEKLEKLSYHLQTPFSYDQYLHFKNLQQVILKPDAEAIHLIDEGLTILREIGKKLERVVRLRTSVEKVKGDPSPLEISVLNGKSFTYPTKIKS